MDKRKKKEHDFSITAFRVVQEATGQLQPETEKPLKKKNFDAKALGRKGGRARADKLTPKQRKEIATKAAVARWKQS